MPVGIMTGASVPRSSPRVADLKQQQVFDPNSSLWVPALAGARLHDEPGPEKGAKTACG